MSSLGYDYRSCVLQYIPEGESYPRMRPVHPLCRGRVRIECPLSTNQGIGDSRMYVSHINFDRFGKVTKGQVTSSSVKPFFSVHLRGL